MFSGFVRWFHDTVEPKVSTEVSTFLAPLALDVETAGGKALLAVVQNVINQENAGPIQWNPGQLLQVGIDAGKNWLMSQGVADLNHAVVGVAAAAVANLHADSAGASVTTAEIKVVDATKAPAPVGDVLSQVEGDIAGTLDSAAQAAATLAAGPVAGELAGEVATGITDFLKKELS
jgi:hypothetical protein